MQGFELLPHHILCIGFYRVMGYSPEFTANMDRVTDILKSGESEELLLSLAREFLGENSTWYAYQSTNGPDIVI